MKKHLLSFETADLLLLANVPGVRFDKKIRRYVFIGNKIKLRSGMIKAGITLL